VNYLVWDGRFN